MRSVNGVGHLDQGIFTNCTSLHEDKVQRVRSHVGDGSAPQDLSVLLDISVIIQLCVTAASGQLGNGNTLFRMPFYDTRVQAP